MRSWTILIEIVSRIKGDEFLLFILVKSKLTCPIIQEMLVKLNTFIGKQLDGITSRLCKEQLKFLGCLAGERKNLAA